MDQLLSAVIGVVVGFALSYVRKKGENLATKEDIGEITRQIEAAKTEYIGQAEQIRADITAALHERQTRFAGLYERQARAIDGLYWRLMRTQDAFLQLPTASYDDAAFTAAGQTADDLVGFFNTNKLYLNKDIIDSYAELNRVLRDVWRTFNSERRHGGSQMPPHVRQQQIENWTSAAEAVSKTVPLLLLRIEQKMRELLGESAPTDHPPQHSPET